MKDLINQLTNNKSVPKKFHEQEKNDTVISEYQYSYCLFIYCTNLRIRLKKDKIDIRSLITIEHALEQTCLAFQDYKQVPNLDKLYMWLRENDLMTWDKRLAYFVGKPENLEIMNTAWIDIPQEQQRPRKNCRIKS